MAWESFLDARPIAVIATIGEDGAPHAVPVEVVVRDGKAYCWCERASAKARNAVRAGRAAIVAYKGHSFVMLRGPVRIIGEGEAGYAEITRAFLEKYKREETYGNDSVIELTPEHLAVDLKEPGSAPR